LLATYAAALLPIVVSVPLGAAILALSGRERFSWLAAPVGLAAAIVIAWWAVRLPGEGLTALIALGVLALGGGGWALGRLEGVREELTRGLPVLALVLIAASIPFAAEGHFGILGTGFNVDMSQHLYAAEWIERPLSPPPDLVVQGYPVGPHALAVAATELQGNLALAFTGTTIAVPALLAAGALAALERASLPRGIVAGALVALPYLLASYLAQGAFKELYMAAFLAGFAIWLVEVRRDGLARRLGAVPGAVLVAGVLYAYSGPGLAWIAGTLAVWALLELLLDSGRAPAAARRAAPAALVGALVLIALALPEADRIANFGGNAGSVANAAQGRGGGEAADREQDARGGTGNAAREELPAGGRAPEEGLDLFDNALGNLFGDISPLEAFGVWPSGDFRVEPGAGAIPAPAFYLGALLGLVIAALAIPAALRRGGEPLVAALVAAAAIWLAARVASTPYTTAKALAMIAPLLSLVLVRGLIAPASATERSGGSPTMGRALAGLLALYLAAAGVSSALALANAPVGPERYTAGITNLRDRLAGEAVLLLAPPGQLADRHGAEFYGWELRGARPICVEPYPGSGPYAEPAPEGVRWVITLGGKREAPFAGVEEAERSRRVALWENPAHVRERSPAIDPDEPTRCELDLPAE
jgi:hypothetical protein